MAKFKIEWSKDKVEVVEQSDCQTVEQYVNTRFGTAKHTAKVTLVKPKVGEKK